MRGYSELTFDALANLTDVVESMHATIAQAPWQQGKTREKTNGLTGLVYQAIRVSTKVLAAGLDESLARLEPTLIEREPSRTHELILAALNGVIGDYLDEKGSPLAIPMQFRQGGKRLEIKREALAQSIPDALPRVGLIIHGSCANDLLFTVNNVNLAENLVRESGYTPLHLLYNSGRHISTNGRELADQLERLLAEWPVEVEELTVIGHSMGGLVTRSAVYYGREAGHTWLDRVRKIVYLGSPHHGAPLERAGNIFHQLLGATPYTTPLAKLGRLRSAGVTDLRHGYILDCDWENGDRFAHGPPAHTAVPLAEGIEHFAVAACLGSRASALHDRIIGDGMVPVDSALGRHKEPERVLAFPPQNQWIGYGMGHMEMLGHPEVFEVVRAWLAA